MKGPYRARTSAMSLMILVGIFASCGAVRYSSAAPAWGSDLDGKWRVQFTGSVRVQLPVEFAMAGDGADMDATVLSDVGIHFHSAQWRNGSLRMKATTPQGDMKIDARIENGRLVGDWAADHAVGQFMIKGSLEGVRIPADGLAPLRGAAVFDSVWTLVRARHFDPDFTGADWQAVRAELRPQAEAARSDGASFLIISDMLRRVGTSHVSFGPVLLPTGAPRTTAVQVVEWRTLQGGVGYVRIAHFGSVGAELERASAQLDSAFASLAGTSSIIVDLRDNPGGNAGLAAALADHLMESPLRVGAFASRAGLEHGGVRSMDDLDLASLPVLTVRPADAYRQQDAMAELGGAVMVAAGGGRGDSYAGRVGVLVNRGTHSTAEAVAGALGESGRATVLGTRTAGQMLAGRSAQVAPGWQLVWPEYDYRTARGTRLEGVGVVPDIELAGTGDALLQRARAWLEMSGDASRQ